MKRSLGVSGATITLVGLVIGVSIFILPGTLAATAGPAVLVSYGLASLLALLTCLIYAQMGSVFPVTGASFVTVSRLVSPFSGFLSTWMMIGGAAVAMALLSIGFTDYLKLVLPAADTRYTPFALLIATGALNLIGARGNVVGQGVLVAAFLAGLGAFIVGAMMQWDASLLTPFAPNGWSPVISGAVPAFFSYAGFMVIIDIGGEVRDPGRTIPRSLALSFVIVAAVYLLVTLALVGVIPWHELGRYDAPVGEAAFRVLPSWLAMFITVAAAAAAASSVNGLLLGYSRDVLALARIKVLPEALARLSGARQAPNAAVMFLLALSILALLPGAGMNEFATFIAAALLIMQFLVGIAALRLPTQLPDEYRNSAFRIPPLLLKLLALALMTMSLGLLVVAIVDSPRSALAAVLYLLVAAVYYTIRRRNVPVEELIRGEADAEKSG